MTIRGLVFRGTGLFLGLSLAACSAATDDPGAPEPTDDTEQGVGKPPKPCPESLILCPDGWEAKSGPNCKQTCVPKKDTCTPGCGAGETCQECKGVDGPVFACIPDGAVC